MTTDDLVVKAYEKLFDSKHHYDNLSWLVGGPALAFAGALIAYMPSIKHPEYHTQVLERFLVAVFIWLVLYAWHSVYQRNRFWVEAANEAIRDIERRFTLRGAGIAFMEAALTRKVVLKNTNEVGHLISDPLVEEIRATSMHLHVPRLAKLVGLLAVIACFLP